MLSQNWSKLYFVNKDLPDFHNVPYIYIFFLHLHMLPNDWTNIFSPQNPKLFFLIQKFSVLKF